MFAKIYLKYILILVFFNFVKNDEIEDLVSLITSETLKAESYQFPTDNSQYWNNSDNSGNIYDYGKYDFIIVGAGSSGSVVANRLSEVKHWKILLIEAGGEENNITDIPAMLGISMSSERNWGYYSTPQDTCCLGMNNQQCGIPRGRVIGGSGSINALQYVRGNKLDYELWKNMGNPEWSYRNVLPYFRKSERSLIGDGDFGYHGFNGPLTVDYVKPEPLLFDIYINGSKQLGRSYVDYNGQRQYGVGRIQTNIKNGRRVSGGRAYIDPIRNRKNLKIITNSLVTKVLIDRKQNSVYGVEFVRNGITYRARNRKEVILSAGFINSPQILLLSGIGPEKELKRLGINPVQNLPFVGKNYLDHVGFDLNFVTDYSENSINLYELIEQYFNGYGKLTSPVGFTGVSFINTQGNEFWKPPNIQLLYLPLSGSPANPLLTQRFYNYNESVVEAVAEMSNPNNGIRATVCLLHPKSKGDITLKSKNPKDFPKINVKHFSDQFDEDIETLYQGIRYVLKLSKTEPFKRINTTLATPSNLCTNYKYNSRKYWYCLLRVFSYTFFHGVSTTKMGQNPNNSVVDSRLKVHGIEGLRIADCGIMPEITSGNTNAVAFMIGEKASDMIKEDHYIFY